MYIIGGFSATILSYINHFNKEYVGIAFVIGAILAILLLKMGNNKVELNSVSKGLSKNNFKILTIIFLVSCIALILVFYSIQNYYLPLQYFIILSIGSFAIISQILLSSDISNFRQKAILSEILLLSTITFASFLFLFPSPYGNDAPYHVEFINQILNSGYLPLQGQYENYPVYHLLFVANVLLAKIASFKLVQFVLLLIQLIFVLFIFSLSKRFFNPKVALISTLIVSFCPYLSQAKYMYFPGSFSAIFFILAFYLIFRGGGNDLRYSLLLIVTLITLILSHPMTPVILMLAFFIILIDSKLETKRKLLSFSAILFVGVSTLAWWMKPSPVIAGNLFSYMVFSIKNAVETVDYSAVGRATLSSVVNPTSIMLTDLGYIIIITLSIIGAIYLLGNYSNKENDTFYNNKSILAIITLIFIPIPYFLTMAYPQSLPNRWFPFIEAFASIFAGYAVFLLFETLVDKKQVYKFVGIFSVTFLIFLLVSNPVINPNSQLYANDLSVRSALTTSELSAVSFTDLYSNINEVKGNSKYLAFAYQNTSSKNFIDPSDPKTYSNGTIIVRSYDLKKGFTIPLYGSKGALLKIIGPPKEFFDYLNKSNEIYNNGNLQMYSKAG